jgi:probable rRNA maturation factor
VITIEIANSQINVPIDEERLHEAVRVILEDRAIEEARVSVAVVDDPTIAALHQKYLDDGDPTDVLSFLLESSDGYLEGEIVVSAQTAAATAPQYGWTAADELLLYVIHGTLHLVGCDDATPAQRAAMRAQERQYLAHFGLEGRYEREESV